MTAKEFWPALEYRVCREIDGLPDGPFKHLWCDGFIPEAFDASTSPPQITGRVWMARDGSGQWQWDFVLLLPESVKREEDIDWQAIFPAEDVTGWLSLNEGEKILKVRPLDARPDPF